MVLSRIIHEDFYWNRRDTAPASWTAGGRAAQSINVLLGTGADFPDDCPRSGSGTGTAADDGASPLASQPRLPPMYQVCTTLVNNAGQLHDFVDNLHQDMVHVVI